MAGRDGFGADFIKLASATATSGTNMAEVTNINGPGIEGEDIDVTSNDSTEAWREFLPGLVDGGEVEVELNYTPAEYALQLALFRTTNYYRIQPAGGEKFTFLGYLKGLENEVPHDDKISATATYKVSGKPTYSTN